MREMCECGCNDIEQENGIVECAGCGKILGKSKIDIFDGLIFLGLALPIIKGLKK